MSHELFADTTPIDEAAIRRYRINRIRKELLRADLGGIVIYDPVNLRYATGTRNMQVWTMHNPCRYAVVFAEGPLVQFELPSAMHLSAGVDVIDEIRPAVSFDYMVTGERSEELAGVCARSIVGLIEKHLGAERTIAIDRADALLLWAMERLGVRMVDGKSVTERARSIKSHEEIRALRASLATCEESLRVLYAEARPGMTEAEALGILLCEAVSRGGEYPETRLMSSGPRTNPWFQETSDRTIEAGDLLCFDTDLIGPMGFYNDISRSWVMGERHPSAVQETLFSISEAQVAHNAELLQAGVGFIEYSDKTFKLPDKYLANRYADVAHGCGLGVEYPFIWYPEDHAAGRYDGHFEVDMVVCIESYVGELDGVEGVKLEQPYWISDEGPVLLSDFPLRQTDL